MKRILLLLLALFFPWIAMLVEEKPGPAFACLALQLTFIGWIPASIWAMNVVIKLNPKQSKQQSLNNAPVQNSENNNINKETQLTNNPIATEENKPNTTPTQDNQ